MYTVLDPTKREVRLLRLLAGNEEDDINCELHTASLDSPDDYEALSYVWGSASETRNITVQQTAKNVTVNLEAALRHLRYPDRTRMLWVDVVCIDQDNVQERNQQVRWMSDIYSTAAQVVVWLGPGTRRGFTAMDIIEKYAADSELHWPEDRSDTELFHMYHFLSNEWWSRVWTVQEAVLAKQLTYQLGSRLLSESDLLKAAVSYRNHAYVRRCCYSCLGENKSVVLTSTNIAVGMEKLLDLDGVRTRLQKEKLRFDKVISRFHTRRATDPRDRVFGLLGISRGVSTASIDYALNTIQAFEATTREFMSYCENLDILSHCAHQAYQKETTAGIPSWVPDWGAENRHDLGNLFDDYYLTAHRLTFLDTYNACGRLTYAPCLNVAENSISLLGVFCDRIERLGQTERGLMVEPGPEYLFEWWKLLDTDGNPNRPYRGGSTISDAFWRTICLDIGVDGFLPDSGLEARRAGSDHERWFMKDWNSQLTASQYLPQLEIFRNSGTKEAFIQHLMRASGRRQFFISTQGFIGLGPPDIKVGDKICVFAGGKMPFIVRDVEYEINIGDNTSEKGSHFRLLGDAYVHGLMYGQAVRTVEQGVEELKVFKLH